MGRISPACEGEHRHLGFFFGFAFRKETCASLVVVRFAFGILGAAMFAEPSVAEIEKVIGLIHRKLATGNSGREVWGQVPEKLVCLDPWPLTSDAQVA